MGASRIVKARRVVARGLYRPGLLGLFAAATLLPLSAPVAGTADSPGGAGSAEGLRRGTIRVDGRERTFHAYVPGLPAQPPFLVLAFHGSRGSGLRLRHLTGRRLETLAERRGAILVYPDGFEGHWNDCRAAGPYAANVLDVDDPGFVRALVRHFGADRTGAHVFALGYSNGAHMAFRLALEAPESVTGIAAFAAGLPTRGDSDCTSREGAVAALLVSGTDDPINPFAGGPVVVFGEERGSVLSAHDTAAVFATRAGHTEDPTRIALPDRDPGDGTRVELLSWRRPPLPEVGLMVVAGGGHTIPQPHPVFPAFVGPTSRDVDALEMAFRFFERQAAVR
jgi:polyhydroxybutyrate depolymerase